MVSIQVPGENQRIGQAWETLVDYAEDIVSDRGHEMCKSRSINTIDRNVLFFGLQRNAAGEQARGSVQTDIAS